MYGLVASTDNRASGGYFSNAAGSGNGAGVWGIGIEADGTIKGCPSMATETWAYQHHPF